MWHSVSFESREEFLCILNMKHFDTEIRFRKSVLTRKYSLCFLGSKKCLCLFVVNHTFQENAFSKCFFFKKIHNYCINRILWFEFAYNILLDFINRDQPGFKLNVWNSRPDVMLTASFRSVYLDDFSVLSHKCLKIRSSPSYRSFWKTFLESGLVFVSKTSPCMVFFLM